MFGYLRLFSIFSLLLVVAVSVTGGIFLHGAGMKNALHDAESHGMGIARGYAEDVWIRYRSVIVPLSTTQPDQLRTHPQVLQFAQETMRYLQHASPLRINIYNGSGLPLMSVNTTGGGKIAGSRLSPNENFVARNLRGSGPKSDMLEGVMLSDNSVADVLQLIYPMRDAEGNVEGALEILTDVSASTGLFHRLRIFTATVPVALFLIFLIMVLSASRRAENIIAKQHETNIELAEAAATAEAQNREKSQFLANISHELRTPLNAIIGFSEIIKNEVIAQLENKKYHDYISDIYSSGVHLLSLINDILDYSKAEAGKLELEVSEVNASKIVQNSMRLVSPRAEAASVNLVEALPKEPIIMLMDSKKFKQVLLNLLSNAVKFTPAGGEVRISAWRNAADDTYSFEVKDTGIGIAPKDISRAMAPFGQVDSTFSRKYEGTGLGLPLTKKFVEIMGGTFSIESEVNVGTTIVFTLPRELKEREGLIIKYLT